MIYTYKKCRTEEKFGNVETSIKRIEDGAKRYKAHDIDNPPDVSVKVAGIDPVMKLNSRSKYSHMRTDPISLAKEPVK